ncbi:MAG: insulinase family protein [Chlamydiales bacterium]|nr:insulinase family protein [Chlamydiales bacterium]
MYGNFAVTRISEISEIQTSLIELEHLPSGAQVMQIANDDEENLFNLSFRTWPDRSNGVAHILEHVVLCGSERFPVRDPFFSMNRRSLNTFMNALTGADFTCYPAASQVEKDFYNLLEVYLDAVFKPKLTELSFRQEGHRLEFLNPEDPNSPLMFKGVVYNEMKGAMASGEARLSENLMHALFPDLTYGVNSGGDPKEIPTLTYEELKAFHAKFYHPSRCLFYFYGNLPLEKHLAFLEEHALAGVEKLSPLPFLPRQPRFQKGIVKTLAYPISEEDDPTDKMLMGLSWLTCGILEQVELMALCLLDVVLMGTDAAPLKEALLKSNLCKQTDSMIDTEMSEIPFAIICKGCRAENGEAIEKIIRETLSLLVENGIPTHLIDGAIHQIEMARTEITGNSSPYGLHLFFRSALLKQHGGNPEDGLRVHSLFAQLREKVKDPIYLTKLIEKHFLKNNHYARITMLPEKELVAQESEEEQTLLVNICASLKDPDVKRILDQAKELEKLQEESESQDIDILPKVTLADVAPDGKEFPLEVESFERFDLYYHPCFTNDILYADLVFDLPAIAEEELAYLRLFSLILPQIGCGGRDYRENLEYLLQHTGGIGVSLDLGIQADDPGKMRPSLTIRGKALYRKMDKFFPVFRDLLTSADFKDISRIRELLMQHFSGLENSIQHNSLRYAVNLASRGLSVPSTICSVWYGLDYYYELKKIIEEFDKDPAALISRLEKLQELCLGIRGGDLVLSCDKETIKKLKSDRFYGLMETPSKPFVPWKGDYPIRATESQGRMIASPVAFTALLFSSVCYTDPHAPALSVASEIMENKVLHKRIREQGGAYGAGAINGVLSGQFYFYAYRDPHLNSTIEAFHEAIETIAAGAFDASEIEEAQLGLFQDLDAPTPPGARAITTYGRLRGNRTPEVRQLFRERLLKLSREEIIHAVKKHLITGIEKGVLVSFAGKGLLGKENPLLKETLPLYSI